MGTMKTYKCKNCGYSKQLYLGSGMMFSCVCDDVKESIVSGAEGPDVKEAYDSCELPGVCPENRVYVCPDCGYWDVYKDISIYEPIDIAAAKKEKFGVKTVGEWGGIPYVMEYEIQDGKYRPVYEYSPICPKCDGTMRNTPETIEDEIDDATLKCPCCGDDGAIEGLMGFWD